MKRLFLVVLAMLVACSGGDRAGGAATPQEAAVVLMRDRLATDPSSDGDGAHIEQIPVCGGVAVSASLILTAAHCVTDATVKFADAWSWAHTSNGFALATLASVDGDNATLTPAAALSAWVQLGAAVDGPAELVLLRGTDLVTVSALVTSARVDAQLEHGDSGSGVFQSGKLVGIVQTCDAPVPDDGVTCLPTGGKFSAVR